MIEIDKHEIALRTNHLLVELYKSGMRGVEFGIWVDKGYFYLHICIHRRNFQIQWWKGKKQSGMCR